MANVRFDESLRTFLSAIERELGGVALNGAVILRDGTGQLSAVLAGEWDPDRLEEVAAKIAAVLGGYARPAALLRSAKGLSGLRLLEEAQTAPRVNFGGRHVAFIDRRVVGADWLLQAKPDGSQPRVASRIAFTSLKGGVGRSTALCVAAVHLSMKGLRVLAIDLDLEAPGIGTMLLDSSELPKYGVVDYLVENGLSGIDQEFITELVANSKLGGAGARVAVVPAFGSATFDQPENALSKLARAYVEDIDDAGGSKSVGHQIAAMVDMFEATGDFDVILIDARAGLHEISASVFTLLDADTLMFGTDQPQTYMGYRLLLAHLANQRLAEDALWADRLRFVHSRASRDEESTSRAAENFGALYAMLRPYPEAEIPRVLLTIDDFVLDWGDDDDQIDVGEIADVISIAEDPAFRNFDPHANPLVLQDEAFRPTFDALLELVDALVEERADSEL